MFFTIIVPVNVKCKFGNRLSHELRVYIIMLSLGNQCQYPQARKKNTNFSCSIEHLYFMTPIIIFNYIRSATEFQLLIEHGFRIN